jgi:hypothetical protein
MTEKSDTIRVVIPLKLRKKNGRPTILPPADYKPSEDRTQDPHILRAIGRAWAWRRRLEAGEIASIDDLAEAEKVSDRFVSRTLRLTYLSPKVLRRLLIERQPPTVDLPHLIDATREPWEWQMEHIFE